MEIPIITAAQAKGIAHLVAMQSPRYNSAMKRIGDPEGALTMAIIETAITALSKKRASAMRVDCWDFLTNPERIDVKLEELSISGEWFRDKMKKLSVEAAKESNRTRFDNKPALVWPVVSSLVR